MKIIFKYEWLQFIRNKTAVMAWLLMLLIGLYAVYYGRSFQQRQLQTIYQLDTAYQANVAARLKKFANTDTTTKEAKADYKEARDAFMGEYFSRPMIWKEPQALQGLTIGQSDNQPFFYNMWVSSKVYNNKLFELRNPAKLKAGNFDLAFVIIYLLPLLLIAYCYAILAADKESGVAKLLLAQGVSTHKILWSRLCFRAVLVLSLAFIVSIAGFAVNGVNNITSIAGWLGTTTCYLLFWVAVCCLFVSLQKSTGVTALLLVSSWVVLLLVVPAGIQKMQKTPDSTGTDIADADRDYGSLIWKMPKAELLDSLHTLYPGWKKYPVKDSNLIRGIAYYVLTMRNMNRLGEARDLNITASQQWLQRFDIINPAFAAQLTFNKLAQTELTDFIAFKKAASAYQLQRMDYINVFRMTDTEMTKADFQNKPVFQQPLSPVSFLQWFAGVLPLLLLTVCGFITGYLFTKKTISHT